LFYRNNDDESLESERNGTESEEKDRKMAVQQDIIQISNSLSSTREKRRARRKKGPKSPSEKCCLILIMISPVLLVLMIMYFMSIYNEAVQYEQKTNLLLRASEGRKETLQLHSPQQQVRSRNNHIQNIIENDKIIGEKKKEILVLTTSHGDIRIRMRPDLSAGSVDYIHRLVETGCQRCKFYRAEQKGILQGIMAKAGVAPNTEKGSCPPEAKSDSVGNCPEWDANCACHGPIMTRGAVGWAAGQAGGPDFFVDNYRLPATWWGTQHTNFGMIQDKKSLDVIDYIFTLPTEKKGLTFLKEEIHFQLRLE
jgi:cyclophilin family peptidyl-prolyl cis-trans isomerase